MSNRFVDNETPLNAETLNRFEDELKQAGGVPLYHAVCEPNNTGLTYKAYRISEVEWSDIPVGSLFSVIFDQSTKGTSNDVVGLRFGETNNSSKYLFYATPDYNITFKNSEYVKVNQRKYLLSNIPYVMKKVIENDSSTPMIILMDFFDTSNFGTGIAVSNGKLVLKNLDGSTVGETELPQASESVFGGAKIWASGSTLNINTK